MLKSKAFELADPVMIAKMFATNADDYHLSHIKKFCSYNNELPQAVINMMIMYIIAVDSKNKPAGELPRLESYYRITHEDWISKGIKTPEATFMYYEQAIDETKNIQKYINQGTAKENLTPRLAPSKPFIQESIDPQISAALDQVYKQMK
jgi:hypothetical protein